MTSLTTVTAATPNINSTALTTTVFNTPINPITGNPTSTFEGSPSVATPLFDFFGQKFITNNLTAAYDLTDHTVFTLTYHHQEHNIGEGAANTTDTCLASPTTPSKRTAEPSASLCSRRATGTSTVRSNFCTPTMSSPRSHPASFSITEFTPNTGPRPGRRSPVRTMTSSATTIRTIQAQRPLMARSSTSIIAAR